MSFTYFSSVHSPRVVDPQDLKHPYFVQLAPDGVHLVPGVLQQGKRPSVGKWLQVGYIEQDLPERYFVQQTDFHTLVPGSLLPGDRFPTSGVRWKELKGLNHWHKVVYDGHPFSVTNAFFEPVTFGDISELNTELASVLELIYPDVTLPPDLAYKLYYYDSNFENLHHDPSKLTLFGAPGAGLRIHVLDDDTYTGISNIGILDPGVQELQTTPDIGIQTYAFVVGILDSDGRVMDYIVLENIFIHFINGD